jgi:hypothetical protein
MMTLRLTDHCCYNEGFGHMGVNVRLFGKQVNMPTIESLGDIVLIRQFKRMDSNGTPFLISAHYSHIMCFPAATIPDPVFKHAFGDRDAPPHTKHPLGATSTNIENYYVIALRDWASGIKDLPRASIQPLAKTSFNPPKGPSSMLSLPNRPPPPTIVTNGNSMAPLNAPKGPSSMMSPPKRPAQPSTAKVISRYQDRKFSLLKDIKDGTYVSLVGEVRKLWGNLNGTQMYLTDYSSNSLLFDYKSDDGQMEGGDGDQHGYLANMQKRGWKGPFGKMTIQITLWPPHDSFVNAEVLEGDVVLVRNVHIAFMNKYLEGKLHTDRRFPQQVDVRKIPLSDPLVLAMKGRQHEYEEHKLAAENKKPSARAEKKKKRKEREKQARMQQDGGGDEMPNSGAAARQETGVTMKGNINANGNRYASSTT